MKHQLPDLPYGYDALEPYIDAQTMNVHHTKHHAGYVNNLNVSLEKHPQLKDYTVDELLMNQDKLPQDIQTAVRNNGGGHSNHSLFWKVMSPDGGGEPKDKLGNAISDGFGNFASFKSLFEKAATTRFGSGWTWLCRKKDGSLMVTSTPNQDSPLSEGLIPILGLDVWEHAYYLKYQNRRAEYIANWWNVVNWEEVTRRLTDVREFEASMKR